MKKILSLKFLLFVIALTLGVSEASAQQYHSRPTAKQNLQDEAAFVQHQLTNVYTAGTPEYDVASEKLRFINILLEELNDTEANLPVETIAERFVPNVQLNKMQIAVKYMDSSHTGTTTNRYIHNEMMALISY